MLRKADAGENLETVTKTLVCICFGNRIGKPVHKKELAFEN